MRIIIEFNQREKLTDIEQNISGVQIEAIYGIIRNWWQAFNREHSSMRNLGIKFKRIDWYTQLTFLAPN